jgi:hypothetical protein
LALSISLVKSHLDGQLTIAWKKHRSLLHNLVLNSLFVSTFVSELVVTEEVKGIVLTGLSEEEH